MELIARTDLKFFDGQLASLLRTYSLLHFHFCHLAPKTASLKRRQTT